MRRHVRGFTLVEVLVVIAIIGVLVAFLLPSLRKARESARVVTCASNLHQWGAILNMYQIDNKGAIPDVFYFLPGRYPSSWSGASSLEPGVISAEMMSRYVPGINLTSHKISQIWLCASVTGTYPELADYMSGSWALYGYFETCYSYFGHVEKWGAGIATNPEDLTANKLRADRLLMCDQLFAWGGGIGGTWDYNHGRFGPSISDPAFTGFHDPGPPDITGINSLMGDGSVRWKDRATFNLVEMQNIYLTGVTTPGAIVPRVKAANPRSSTFY